MKQTFKTSILASLLLMMCIIMMAQPTQRKNDTKILDALNQLPAENVQLYNRLMGDIESTGQEGIDMLIAILERNDDARVKVEYALDAYAAYAGASTFPATEREELKKNLLRHINRMNATLSGNDAKDCEEHPWTVTNRELLVRMLRNIAGYKADAPLETPDIVDVQKTLAKALKNKDRNIRIDAIMLINNYATEDALATSLADAEKVLPKLKDDAKIDVLYWMGINPTIANTTNAKALLKSKNAEVVSAAAWTLTRVGKAEDLSAVASLLNGTDEQKSLAAACLKSYPGNVVDAIKTVQGDNLCAEAKAVVDARTGADIPVVVLTPCEEAVSKIKRSLPGDQKLEMLKAAMPLAANAEEQCMVLENVARTWTIPSVLYAGEYLDNPATAQAAAQAIRVLTSGHDDINGADVRALMIRAKETITGGDADYQRIEIQNQLDKLNAEAAKHHSDPYELTEQEKKEGFQLLFDGSNLDNFQGDFVNYHAEEGNIYVKPRGDGFGNLYTKEQYEDFIFRFEFKLTHGANNGIGVRAEMGKDAAYYGMEIQVLDHYDAIYQPGLRDYQYHGSVYGIIPTQNRDCLKPVGEWNEEEIYIKGTHVRVTLNGTVITEGDIKEATKNGNYDHLEHPGLFNKTGYIGFLGHGSELWFRHVRVKRLK